MSSEFDDALDEMFEETREVLGEVTFTVDGELFEGQPKEIKGTWNALGREETLEINGRTVSFSVLVEADRSQFSAEPRVGQLVTRDGKTYRITGEVQADQLTYRFPLDSRHK